MGLPRKCVNERRDTGRGPLLLVVVVNCRMKRFTSLSLSRKGRALDGAGPTCLPACDLLSSFSRRLANYIACHCDPILINKQ